MLRVWEDLIDQTEQNVVLLIEEGTTLDRPAYDMLSICEQIVISYVIRVTMCANDVINICWLDIVLCKRWKR